MVDLLFGASPRMPRMKTESPAAIEEPEELEKMFEESIVDSRSIIVRLKEGGQAKRMPDYFAVIRELERRFGKIRDFKIQKVCAP